MATLVMQPGQRFDPVACHQRAAKALPSYAIPLFIRVKADADITATFKLRKVDLQKSGYAAVAGDELYAADAAAGRYVALSEESLSRLGIRLRRRSDRAAHAQ